MKKTLDSDLSTDSVSSVKIIIKSSPRSQDRAGLFWPENLVGGAMWQSVTLPHKYVVTWCFTQCDQRTSLSDGKSVQHVGVWVCMCVWCTTNTARGEVYGYTLSMRRKSLTKGSSWLDLDAWTWLWSLIMTCNRASCFQIPLSYLNVLKLTSCHYLQMFY